VTTAGLLYPLDNADLVGGTTLGLSNQVSVIENQPHAMISVRVSVATGRLLVCVVNDDI